MKRELGIRIEIACPYCDHEHCEITTQTRELLDGRAESQRNRAKRELEQRRRSEADARA